MFIVPFIGSSWRRASAEIGIFFSRLAVYSILIVTDVLLI